MPPRAPTRLEATLAWWLWVLAQAAVLALFAGRVHMTAGYPAPVEATADLAIGVTQVVLAAMLAPALLADRTGLVRALAAAAVYSILAACLAGRTVGQEVPVVVVSFAWLIAYANWSPTPLAGLVWMALAVAGPVLAYAGREYHSPPLSWTAWPWQASPPLGICSTRLHNDPWIALSWPAAGIGLAAVRRLVIRAGRPLHGDQQSRDQPE